MAKPVKLRQISSQQVAAIHQLGRGLQIALAHDDQALQLQLRLSDHHEDALDWTIVTTAAGSLMLERERAEALLNRLSSAPFVLAEDSDVSQQWYTHLYNARLHGSTHKLFGFIEQCEEFIAGGIACRFDITDADEHDFCRAIVPYGTLSQLLERGRWRNLASWPLPDLQLNKPLCLGRLTLPRKSVQRLQPGDVILPSQTVFDIAGNGFIQFGNRTLQLQFFPQGTQPGFTVTQVSITPEEEDPMQTANYQEDIDSQGDEAYGEPEMDLDEQSATDEEMIADNFDATVQLSICCGQVSISLSELGQLTEGAVIMATGERPGHAAVYHRNRVIARGELVDVDGRLGLQITGLEQSL